MGSSGITINSNLSSLRAQRELARTSNGLQRTFERLSSGLRIVRASDDAAGLAIASSLSVDSRVYTQGIRNLNDGLSYLNIADGAIDQLKTIVTRCRELATQAANGTMTSAQRQSLHQEAQALSEEYNRILNSSEFNGSRVFDATNSGVEVQCGYGTNESITARTGEGVITTETQRASTTSAGAEATGASYNLSISADGRYLAFASEATNLVSGDTNGRTDVFVKDLQTGEIRLVSTTSSGAQGNANSNSTSISADGRYVTFFSFATDLVTGDTNGDGDAFVKDLQTGELRRVSTDSAGAQGTGRSYAFPGAISADGRYVTFSSDAPNLITGDSNGQYDIFIKDLQTGVTRRVSTDSSGGEATGGMSQRSSISADGRYVAFQSEATNLVSGDTNSEFDIFVKDLHTNETRRVSTSSSGAQATGGSFGSWFPAISGDGRYVTFQSDMTNLVSGDTNGQFDIFLKDLQTGETLRVSTDSSGGQATGGRSDPPSISADGRYVAFYSQATNLVSGDTNGQFDVFIKDVQTGETRRVSLDSSGAQATGGSSEYPTISADGRFVAFASNAANLVSNDTNAAMDAFVVNNTTISDGAGFISGVRPLVGIFLKNRTLARMAQSTLDDYLAELNIASGLVGSSMSRFSVAVSTLGVRTENFTAAASRITDVDVAEESSALTQRKILQQAASAVLAQANQQPSIALLLLTG